MELYARVRRAVQAEGISEREAARQFGLARETVRKMLRYSIPPGYRRQQPARRPKLDAWVGIIDQILEQDKAQSKKQRHTAKRVFERLREEHGFPGGYTIVKDYVRLRKLSQREMFVPLEHPPGEAQADFGEAQVVIGGVERKAHYFVMELPQSDDCFVMAFPAETTEAFLEGYCQVEAEEQLTLSAPPHGIEQCVDCRSVPWPVADVVQPNDPLRVDDYVASQLADIATRHPETPPP